MQQTNKSKVYLVGAGIASLSAAVYLINDAHVDGKNISIFDESKKIGGSLDAQDLSASDGYVMRGIRMFEEKAYSCTFDLMSHIPSLNTPGKNVRQEFVDFNKDNKSYSKSRLLKDGHAINSRPLSLKLKDRINLFRLLARNEKTIQEMTIEDFFSPDFFRSNFWYEFCTVFAFQPWHSLIEFRRYLIRFIQDFPTIDTLQGIESSPYNQYEFLVLPIFDWLKKQGVQFVLNTKISDVKFETQGKNKSATQLFYTTDGVPGTIVLDKNDYVFFTLGSIVANTSTGSMTKAPSPNFENKDASWQLWENISKKSPDFGRPQVFNSHIDKSRWTSFTITFRDPTFFNMIEKFIDKNVNAYGGVNLIGSNWLMSIVLSYKPYFLNQPPNVSLCWGYGLFSKKEGNFVHKKMSECTGEEILIELIHHLGFEKDMDAIIKSAICIPCLTPFVTSNFLPRKTSDRPKVVPKISTNFAFIGQYCEIPGDITFTVEYSIHSAQIAVHKLFKVRKKVTPMYKGTHHPRVVFRALKAVFR